MLDCLRLVKVGYWRKQSWWLAQDQLAEHHIHNGARSSLTCTSRCTFRLPCWGLIPKAGFQRYSHEQ